MRECHRYMTTKHVHVGTLFEMFERMMKPEVKSSASFPFCFQPETVGSLPSLEELWLDCNDLIELPKVSSH